jgi:rhomboid protease GluP
MILQMGAKLGSLIQTGEWWRFFTPIFCQNGIISLVLACLMGYLARSVEVNSGFLAAMLFLFAGGYGLMCKYQIFESFPAQASVTKRIWQ